MSAPRLHTCFSLHWPGEYTAGCVVGPLGGELALYILEGKGVAIHIYIYVYIYICIYIYI